MTAANQVAAQTAQSAATATPTQQATVQGQLSSFMQDFEGGQTPSWAAGAMRRAQDVLAARGLGASTIAGQASFKQLWNLPCLSHRLTHAPWLASR